ncbi:hypothetical protein X739_28250 [Mesorhizobium sp. LNHC220B00]|nr:hypothetical protein X739_28250 [Mesorhizobium sp. LNHC220B00]
MPNIGSSPSTGLASAEARDRLENAGLRASRPTSSTRPAANLGVHKDLVLGHSWGAWIALEMARRHAPSVAGLVFVSGYYYPSPKPGLALAALPAVPLIGSAFRHTLLPLAVRLGWPSAMQRSSGPGRSRTFFR